MHRILHHLSRGIILKRKLPRRFGGASIFVSPDASLRYWKPSLESIDPRLYDSIAELVKPGDVVWDVGANVGLFTFAAAHVAGPSGRVLTMEPDSFLSGLLHRSAASLPKTYAPVDVLSVAISDRIEVAELNIARGGRASNSLGAGRSQMAGCRGTQSTLCLNLDWLLDFYPAPDVLKIDVEGLESAVLRGATTLLTTSRPRIHCEMGTNDPFDLLKSHGYTMFDAEEPLTTRRELTRHVFNTIALPS